MPVPTERVVKCSCGKLKGQNNRWFLWAVDGSEWHFDRYQEDLLAHYDGAACGIQCLLVEAQKHADALNDAHPAGGR